MALFFYQISVKEENYDESFYKMPSSLCNNCAQQITAIEEFRNTCIQNDRTLREYITKLNSSEPPELKDDDEESYYLSEEEVEENCSVMLENVEILEEPITNHTAKHKKNRKDYNIACDICGKMYSKGDMKFHLNTHEGEFNFR